MGISEIINFIDSKLKLIPRLGMIVITTIFILMLNATHQLFGF